ncbi:MAG: carbohydrate ABC transporter permease [Eubacteriales bacterium]|nr:carbohydrate ABC transporter permease [Eubacteriales bacterium]
MQAGKKRKLKTIVVVIIVIFISIFALLPFFEMVIMGTYQTDQLYTGVKLLPGNYLKQNLQNIMQHEFFRFYVNSFIVAITNTLCGMAISTMAGYAFAKYQFKGQNLLFLIVISALAIPPQLGLVGFVIEMRSLGWANSLLPLIVNGIANPFGVFWMRQYITSSVPNELLESGRIDGCGEFRILTRLVVPIIKPALITIFLIFFLWSWNDYMVPLVITTNQKYYTIPISISLLSTEFKNDDAARILCLTLSTIPILGMFSIGSKYLIQGLVAGSVKG